MTESTISVTVSGSHYRYPSAAYALLDVTDEVLLNGVNRESRNGATRELRDHIFTVTNPKLCLPPKHRRASLALAAAEALQLVAGVSDPDLLVRIAPRIRRFRDGSAFWGAYGPRVASAMPHVLRKLTEDPRTRQAHVSLWDPRYDDVPGRRDYPCTVSYLFWTDDAGRLCLKTHMRSNDAWLGLPYDLFQHMFLQKTVADALGLPYGDYTHHADSMHLYETDVDRATQFTRNYDYTTDPDRYVCLGGLGSAVTDDDFTASWTEIADYASSVLDGSVVNADVDPSTNPDSVNWMIEQLTPYYGHSRLLGKPIPPNGTVADADADS